MGAQEVEPGKYYCEKCRKTMGAVQFFTYKDGSKSELCKQCLTMHINNWEPETFKWLLEKFDVPYLPWEWDKIRDKQYAKDPYKMNGNSVFGRYLAKMKLNQWNKYHWSDTERLVREADELANRAAAAKEEDEKLENMRKLADEGAISESQYQTYAETQIEKPIPKPESLPNPYENGQANPAYRAAARASVYPVNDNPFEEIDLPDVGNDLTQEDKIYLATKWGRFYSAEEWVTLEKKYNDFTNSFDIHSAATIDTLIFICKTSLKMNQALDSGDIESYQKLSRVYDAQMKAAKFTEAQNKEDKSNDFDSIGCIVEFCEKEGGFIPRFYTETPQDKVDVVIADEKSYVKSLVDGDSGLAQQIEQYLKKREILEEQKRNKEKAKLEGKEQIELTDKDIQEYIEHQQKEKEKDIIAEDDDDEDSFGSLFSVEVE